MYIDTIFLFFSTSVFIGFNGYDSTIALFCPFWITDKFGSLSPVKAIVAEHPCNEIKKTAWEFLKNFDHALILREDDPLLPAILKVYEETGIKDGAPQN